MNETELLDRVARLEEQVAYLYRCLSEFGYVAPEAVPTPTAAATQPGASDPVPLGATTSATSGQIIDGRPVAQAVIELARAGRKIHAIKLYREQTGLGLADAKRIVDAIS